MLTKSENENEIIISYDILNYEIIDYNIDLDSSLKEHTNSLFEYFRKTWNISIIILLTAFFYIYFTFKKPNTESKF
jgi:hypothetical protein